MKKLTAIVLIISILTAFMTVSVFAEEDAHKYVGTKKCKMCHKDVHASWLETKHAKAFDILSDEEKKNEKCVACHVHMTPFEDPIPANTGHSFEPRGEACVDCHTDFVVTEEQDFDYRGIQTEIEGLSTQLHEKLAMATSADSSTDSFLRAQFNYEFVHADGA